MSELTDNKTNELTTGIVNSDAPAEDTTSDVQTGTEERGTEAIETEDSETDQSVEETQNKDDNSQDVGAEQEDSETSWLDAYADVDEQFRPLESDKPYHDLCAAAGMSLADVNKKIIENGGVIPEDLIIQFKGSLPPKLVDAYVHLFEQSADHAQLRARYQFEKVQAAQEGVFNVFGGKAGFDEFNSWASKGGMTKEEIDGLNEVLKSDTIPEVARIATLEAFRNKMNEDPRRGKEPLLSGTHKSSPAAQSEFSGYITYHEFTSKSRMPKFRDNPEMMNKLRAQRERSIDRENQERAKVGTVAGPWGGNGAFIAQPKQMS